MVGAVDIGDEIADERLMAPEIAVLQPPHDHFPEGIEPREGARLRKTLKQQKRPLRINQSRIPLSVC